MKLPETILLLLCLGLLLLALWGCATPEPVESGALPVGERVH